MCVCTQAGLDFLLSCFYLFVFFPLSRSKISTLLFSAVLPPQRFPSSVLQSPLQQHWSPNSMCAGSLDPPEAGSAPHCSARYQNLLLMPSFIPTSLGTPHHVCSCIRDSLQALVVPWASSACKNWVLQVMPVHPTPWEEVKSPKAESEQWDQPLSGIWALLPAPSPLTVQVPSCKPRDHPNRSLCSATPPAGSYEVPSLSCSIWSCCWHRRVSLARQGAGKLLGKHHLP